eukprot:Gb_25642 [translate_table: standard]
MCISAIDRYHLRGWPSRGDYSPQLLIEAVEAVIEQDFSWLETLLVMEQGSVYKEMTSNHAHARSCSHIQIAKDDFEKRLLLILGAIPRGQKWLGSGFGWETLLNCIPGKTKSAMHMVLETCQLGNSMARHWLFGENILTDPGQVDVFPASRIPKCIQHQLRPIHRTKSGELKQSLESRDGIAESGFRIITEPGILSSVLKWTPDAQPKISLAKVM